MKEKGVKKVKGKSVTEIAEVRKKSGVIKKIIGKPKKSVGKQIERISTGIENFNSMIEGGFKRNSTNLLVGSSGSGKTIFSIQFLIEGMKKGEKCLYITFEEKKKEFYSNMMKFGWDLAGYEKKGLLTFLEYTPEKVKTMLEEGGGIIESIVLRKKITRMVIDSITSFALLFEDELKKREAALALFNMIRKWNCTSLLTYEDEPFRDQKAASKTLEFESDSIILLYFIRQEKERLRYIEVLKMRGTNHSKQIFPLCMSKGGIVIEKKPCSDIKL